jgi:hypothetical protein
MQISDKLKLAVALLLTSQLAHAATDEVYWRYTVRPGDNLITLGRVHLINSDDWKLVQKLNQVKNPYRMPIGMVLKVPVNLVKKGPATAEVVNISGVAEMQTAKGYSALVVGQTLGPGARLQTKENSKVTIKLADGTLTSMSSNTEMVLDSLSLYSGGAMVDTKLRLQKGQVETHANPKHELGNSTQIITPTAIAAVRGTIFRIAADADSVKEETLDGKVALQAAAQEVGVSKGYGSYAKSGKPPSAPVALLQAADLSQLPKRFETLPVSFDMPQLLGATAWSGLVAADDKLKLVVAEVNSDDQHLNYNDLPDGQYYLSVRAKDKNGLEGYDALHKFVVHARPFAPALTSPAPGAKFQAGKPTLKWDKVAEAKQYLLEVADNAEFKQPVVMQQVDNNIYQFDTELTPHQYFWRVTGVAKTADGQDDLGQKSQISQFVIKALPPKPDISQMQVKVSQNRVYVVLPPPADGFTYQAVLDNPFNHQKNVWVGQDLQNDFHFLLREYGQQVLSLRNIDIDGVAGEAATYEFDAYPP